MATTLYRVDGTKETIAPANGTHWTLPELQALVGGYIEIVRTISGRYMVVDEDGKNKRKPPNRVATEVYFYVGHDIIVGDVVVIDTLEEMNGPREDEDE
jgi:uncharacterized protein DUF3846